MAGNDFVKGRTNNHLTFPMVDATDFATPESALSAAMKIKIYGKLRGQADANFVSSGTGSLTNDIKHVGASVFGLYTIALVKADLSDASAAWYDQYEVVLSATGAAQQVLICDGGIDASVMLQAASRVALAQSLASDAHSAAAQANSRVLLVQSRLSDFDSRLVSDVSDIRSMLSDMQSDFQSRVPKRVATDSQLSNLISQVTSVDTSDMASAVLVELTSYLSDILSAAAQANSRVLVVQSMVSDVRSHVSDLQSDFQSRVPKAVATNSQLSDLHSDLRSFLVVMSGVQSDVYSLLSDHHSDFQSRVPKLVATNSQLSDLASDIKSAVGAITVTLSASDISDIASAVAATAGTLTASEISDIASAVWANTIGARVDSRVLVAQSYLSDIRSHVSDLQSDFQSRVPKRVATDSQLSDALSDIKSAITAGGGGGASASDIASVVWITHATGAAVASRVLQIRNQVSDLQSDFQSRVPKRVATDSQLSDLHSDLKSHLTVSSGVQSDIYSALSDLQSDFQSRVPKRVATDSQLSDLASDVKSAVAVGNSRALLAASAISDVQSAVAVIPSAKLAAHGAAVLVLVVGSGSTTTAVKFSTVEGGAPNANNDFYNGRVIVFTSGLLAGQATSISDYDGASTTATVVALTGAPANAVTAVIV